MKVGSVVSPERLRQMAVNEAGKSKNAKGKTVAMKTAKGDAAVNVKLGSGLEKTAMMSAIYR